MAKDASDLLDNPKTGLKGSKAAEAPVTTVINKLMTTEGKELHLLTQNNQALSNAAQIGLIYSSMFGSTYVARRVELIEELSVSMGGKGRDDLISALQAGGKLPDAFFEKGKNSEFSEAR